MKSAAFRESDLQRQLIVSKEELSRCSYRVTQLEVEASVVIIDLFYSHVMSSDVMWQVTHNRRMYEDDVDRMEREIRKLHADLSNVSMSQKL